MRSSRSPLSGRLLTKVTTARSPRCLQPSALSHAFASTDALPQNGACRLKSGSCAAPQLATLGCVAKRLATAHRPTQAADNAIESVARQGNVGHTALSNVAARELLAMATVQSELLCQRWKWLQQIPRRPWIIGLRLMSCRKGCRLQRGSLQRAWLDNTQIARGKILLHESGSWSVFDDASALHPVDVRRFVQRTTRVSKQQRGKLSSRLVLSSLALLELFAPLATMILLS